MDNKIIDQKHHPILSAANSSSSTINTDFEGDNYLQFSSSSSESLASKTKYRNTCDIVPSLINHQLNQLKNGTSIINDKYYHDKGKIYDLVSTIRLVDSKLNHITVKAKAKKILIVTKIYDIEPVLDTLKLIRYILRICPKMELYIQDELMKIKEFNLAGIAKDDPSLHVEGRIKFWSSNCCTYNPNTFDLVITLGGDGTILFTSYIFQELIPPVLSFSLGSLGFLTEFDFKDHQEILYNVIYNGYQCSIRTRFECTVMRSRSNRKNKIAQQSSFIDAEKVLRDEISSTCEHHINNNNNNNNGSYHGEKISLTTVPELSDELLTERTIDETHFNVLSYSVFNDIVIDRGPNSTMTSLDLFSDNELLTNIEADGLVIATPSGSTAYSLSAGGSLVHPDIPGILISPICPHSLSFRPLVVPESMILRVGVPYDARSPAWCSFDGKNRIELEPGDFLTITTSRFPIAFVKNMSVKNEWFKRLSDTLHWNERKRQKPFNNLGPKEI
ncbi:hypothetical protein DASC09_027180 [Saccharomycopsis crataegensis]|uniref:NAD(+) kinase n=1 Tax=Saccharomycopsis crataegensis TaxID=43959 RepID=A0AAV5QKR5_9ASCO|nr:hypothetical protein DASC09_027180 [Saccharomycopsis crataegensis]